MYRLYHNSDLSDLVEIFEGKVYLNMDKKGKRPTLARHVISLVNWQADFQVIDFDPEEWLKGESTNNTN